MSPTKLIGFLGMFLWAVLWTAPSEAAPTLAHNYYEHWTFTGQTVTLAWDKNEDWIEGDSFEVQIRMLENDQTAALGATALLEFPTVLPRAGHFEFQVRAVRLDPSTQTNVYSEWALSTNPAFAVVNELPMAWVVYCQVAAPGPVVIGRLFNNLNKMKGADHAYQNEKCFLGREPFTRRSELQRLLEEGRAASS